MLEGFYIVINVVLPIALSALASGAIAKLSSRSAARAALFSVGWPLLLLVLVFVASGLGYVTIAWRVRLMFYALCAFGPLIYLVRWILARDSTGRMTD